MKTRLQASKRVVSQKVLLLKTERKTSSENGRGKLLLKEKEKAKLNRGQKKS